MRLPKHEQGSPKDVREYWAVKDELSTADGLIFKGEAIVIPSGLRKVLHQIHQGYLGMERSKLRARELVYWPGMSKQIEDVVSSCAVCQELRHSNARQPMVLHEIPQYQWQVVGTDAFVWGGSHVVAAVDYYSGYWEVATLRNLSTSALIDRLKSIFARHGI